MPPSPLQMQAQVDPPTHTSRMQAQVPLTGPEQRHPSAARLAEVQARASTLERQVETERARAQASSSVMQDEIQSLKVHRQLGLKVS